MTIPGMIAARLSYSMPTFFLGSGGNSHQDVGFGGKKLERGEQRSPLAPFTLALGNHADDAFRLSMIGSGGT